MDSIVCDALNIRNTWTPQNAKDIKILREVLGQMTEDCIDLYSIKHSGSCSNRCFEIGLGLADFPNAAIWLAKSATLPVSIWKSISVVNLDTKKSNEAEEA